MTIIACDSSRLLKCVTITLSTYSQYLLNLLNTLLAFYWIPFWWMPFMSCNFHQTLYVSYLMQITLPLFTGCIRMQDIITSRVSGQDNRIGAQWRHNKFWGKRNRKYLTREVLEHWGVFIKMLFVTKPDVFCIPCKPIWYANFHKTAWIWITILNLRTCTVVIHTILLEISKPPVNEPIGVLSDTAS